MSDLSLLHVYCYSLTHTLCRTTVQEVANLVKCGAAQGLSVTARSGGHSYAAFGVGGEDNHLVIDLSKLKAFNYTSSTQMAVVQTGTRLGELAQQLWTHGQALPHGTCPYVSTYSYYISLSSEYTLSVVEASSHTCFPPSSRLD